MAKPSTIRCGLSSRDAAGPTRTRHSCKTLSHSICSEDLAFFWLCSEDHFPGYRTPGRDYVRISKTRTLLTCRGGLVETLYNTLRALFKRCSFQALGDSKMARCPRSLSFPGFLARGRWPAVGWPVGRVGGRAVAVAVGGSVVGGSGGRVSRVGKIGSLIVFGGFVNL